MIDVGGAEVAADDIADECEVLAPDRLIKTERDRCGVNILGRSCFDVDDVEDRIADAVDADKAINDMAMRSRKAWPSLPNATEIMPMTAYSIAGSVCIAVVQPRGCRR